MSQATERFLRIEAIFNEVLAVPDDARAARIELLCQGDQELAAEVHSLLEACEAEETKTRSCLSGPPAGHELAAKPRRIGPYEIDRLLGRGGMGAVYLAHRSDGHFEQRVAIKLIDLPLATDVFRERFRQERQILAGLQHPYIARLLDGGVTQDGELFLAMEFVDGIPIDAYCEQQNLDEAQRLALFVLVCEAVQFAHQNFVVHRDLKPDNILVASDGTPRLLDFGTAKLTAPSLANPETPITREGFQSFTPQYASPEQILGHAITTASDTYSLGVLLYLLLSGMAPYELKELTTAEMLRTICEEAPRRPWRAADSNSKLDLDLEAIVMKALRKEPAERYRTAEQLAADCSAFLGGRPVGARRDTFRYRAVKFCRRHRLAFAGVAVFAITLIAGVFGVLWQAKAANDQRRMAEARSADLRQLSSSLLSELDEAIKQLPGSTGVQKLLVTRVLEHLDRMEKDAKGDRLTQLDLVDAYTRLGNIQGNAYDQNLGDAEGGLASLGKALAIAEPLVASDPGNRDAVRALALVEQSRSEILWQLGDSAQAVTTMREAIKNFDALIADPRATPTMIGDAASAYGALGDELGQPGTASLGDIAGALTSYRKTIDLDNRALAIDPGFIRSQRGLAILQMKIGNVEMGADPEQALKDFKIALKRTDALPKSERDSLSTVRLRGMVVRKVADSMVQLGEYEQAIPIFDQDVEIDRHLMAADPQDSRSQFDLQIVLSDEAESLEDWAYTTPISHDGRWKQKLEVAEKLWAGSAKIMAGLVKQEPSNESWRSVQAIAQVHLGTLRARLHDGEDVTIAGTGLAVLKKLAKKDQASPLILDQTANAFLSVEPDSLRDPAFAVECAEREVAISHRQKPSQLLTLAMAYHADGQIQKSRATANEGLGLLPALMPGGVKPDIRSQLEEQARAKK